tara:strand:- start:254 stop:520 length:267 start_codon:yes stop_codon:yes gene_type:complete
MNLKNVAKKLSKVRDSIREHGGVSEEDEAALKALVNETIGSAKGELSKLPKKQYDLPVAHNDNQPLNKDQRLRLSLMEKTGTGSLSVH